MSEAHAGTLIMIWYLLPSGLIQCWGELRFSAAFSDWKPRLFPVVVFLVVNRLIALFCFMLHVPGPGNILLILLLFLYNITCSGLSARSAALTCGIVAVMHSFFEGFLDVLMRFTASTVSVSGMSAVVTIHIFVSALLLGGYLCACFFIARRYRTDIQGLPLSGLFVLAPCALIVWCVRMLTAPNSTDSPTQVMELVTMAAWMATSVLAFFSVLEAGHKTLRLFAAQQETHLLERELRVRAQTTRETLQHWENTRAWQHDIRNHLLVVSGLVRQDMHREATEYLEQLVASSDDLSPKISTGNAALDVLLEEKIRFAESLGISVTTDFQIPSFEVVDTSELCLLFANGLDNAVTGCLTAPEDRRYIKITVGKRFELFLIQMENGILSDSSPVIYGTGLQNIHKIALKYNGALQVQKESDIFRLSMLLGSRPSV